MEMIRRGTTPTIKLNIEGVRMDDIKRWYVTISQDYTQITKTNEDMEIEGTLLSIRLTQQETLRFKQSECEIQIRALTPDNTAIASDIQKVNFGRILFNEVIE